MLLQNNLKKIMSGGFDRPWNSLQLDHVIHSNHIIKGTQNINIYNKFNIAK